MEQSDQTVTWAFGLHGSLSKVVSQNFPQDAHRWPVLRYYDFQGCQWRFTHLIIILRDKVSEIPTQMAAGTLDASSAPSDEPSVENLNEWQSFLRAHFNVRPQDAVAIVPLLSNSPKVEEQWEKWSTSDKQLWHNQIEINVTQQFYYLKGFDMAGDFFLPPGYLFLADDCARFFAEHPDYGKNVFIMTRFVSGNSRARFGPLLSGGWRSWA